MAGQTCTLPSAPRDLGSNVGWGMILDDPVFVTRMFCAALGDRDRFASTLARLSVRADVQVSATYAAAAQYLASTRCPHLDAVRTPSASGVVTVEILACVRYSTHRSHNCVEPVARVSLVWSRERNSWLVTDFRPAADPNRDVVVIRQRPFARPTPIVRPRQPGENSESSAPLSRDSATQST